MSLIIGLILLVVLLCRVGSDKLKESEYKSRVDKEIKCLNDWKSRYVDEELERQLFDCIWDERNSAKILEEISPILSNIEHLNDLISGDFILDKALAYMERNYKLALKRVDKSRDIALNIMLAKRGKIHHDVYSIGYRAPSNIGGNLEQRKGAFEYIEAILNTIRGIHPEMEIYYNSGWYVWAGSFADGRMGVPGRAQKFDKKILFPEDPPPIPPIE